MDFLNVWIDLIVLMDIIGVVAEKCMYKQSVYNTRQGVYEKRLVTRDCQWGCCEHHTTPCCSTPVSLIVGCALGGILLMALLAICLCCCNAWHRRNRSQGSSDTVTRAGMSWRGSGQSNVVFTSEASASYEVPHDVYDSPPSYEEVMRGETNPAFKPDSS